MPHPCTNSCSPNNRCKDRPHAGLSFRLHKDDSIYTPIIEARTLRINHLYEWELESGSAYESSFFSSIKLQYDQILSPPAMQPAFNIEPLIISFHSSDFYKVDLSNASLPEYISGIYVLTNVVIKEIALDQDCCCNKMKVIKARGTFDCVTNIDTVPDKDCRVEVYPIPVPVSIKECNSCD
jgi:hypothetical protein